MLSLFTFHSNFITAHKTVTRNIKPLEANKFASCGFIHSRNGRVNFSKLLSETDIPQIADRVVCHAKNIYDQTIALLSKVRILDKKNA